MKWHERVLEATLAPVEIPYEPVGRNATNQTNVLTGKILLFVLQDCPYYFILLFWKIKTLVIYCVR